MSSFVSSGCVYKQSSYKNLVKIYIDLISSKANVEIENIVCYSPESDLSSTKNLEEVKKDNSFSKVTHINCKQVRDNLEFVVRFYEEQNYQGFCLIYRMITCPRCFHQKVWKIN